MSKVWVEPVDSEIYLIYKCPNCSASHQIHSDELTFPGGVLCMCGAQLAFKPLDLRLNTEVESGFWEDKIPVAKPVPADEVKSPIAATMKSVKEAKKICNTYDVVVGLQNLGYNKTSAKKIVKQVIDEHGDFEHSVELLSACIQSLGRS